MVIHVNSGREALNNEWRLPGECNLNDGVTSYANNMIPIGAVDCNAGKLFITANGSSYYNHYSEIKGYDGSLHAVINDYIVNMRVNTHMLIIGANSKAYHHVMHGLLASMRLSSHYEDNMVKYEVIHKGDDYKSIMHDVMSDYENRMNSLSDNENGWYDKHSDGSDDLFIIIDDYNGIINDLNKADVESEGYGSIAFKADLSVLLSEAGNVGIHVIIGCVKNMDVIDSLWFGFLKARLTVGQVAPNVSKAVVHNNAGGVVHSEYTGVLMTSDDTSGCVLIRVDTSDEQEDYAY